MKANGNKVMGLKEAVNTFVTDGCHMSIGGFTLNRNPMAAIYEMIRQGVKDIHLYAHSNGQAVDELIGAGCVANLEIAYGGTGKFMSTCVRFQKAIQNQEIVIEDYSNYHMTLRFLAGAMGVPFLPTRSGLGTDIIEKWGFSKEFRKNNDRLPKDKLLVMDNPFGNWCDTSKVVLVPAINPDVTFIHVQMADVTGNCRIDGLNFADVEQAKASKALVITCEELLDDDYMKNEPDRNQIPFIHADAVVHVPFGAYPTACYNYYDYDATYLKAHAKAAKDDAAYKEYLNTMILGQADHHALLDYVGRARLEMICADKNRGYAKHLDRT